jgi:23S rRNA (pseudouridine1915-N3)-methyltransferase
MRIKLIAVGTKMPAWVSAGYHEYQKRLPAELNLQLIEITPGRRSKGADINRAIEKESRLMLAAVDKGDFVIALDGAGKSWDTLMLSKQLENWQMLGTNICLLVGGPEGLSSECLQAAQQQWSLSALTYPHPLVRIILAEQIYRAWTLLNNHPYHRA